MKNLYLLLLLLFLFSFFSFAQVQLGDDMYSGASKYFGRDVSLSFDGSILATIAGSGDNRVSIKQYIDGNWVDYGSDLEGANYGGVNAKSIVLSDDGSTLATAGGGLVRIYSYESGNWIPKGDPVQILNFDYISLSLSSDGNVLGVGIYQYYEDTNRVLLPPPIYQGLVQVFKFDSGEWKQKGNNIIGTTGDEYGKSLVLSSSGNILGISSISSVRIYNYTNGNWELLGNEIDFSLPFKIDISSDGRIVGISNRLHHPTKIFKFNNNEWAQWGQDITPQGTYSLTGDLGLSGNGSVLAIGEVDYYTETAEDGQVYGYSRGGRGRILEYINDS